MGGLISIKLKSFLRPAKGWRKEVIVMELVTTAVFGLFALGVYVGIQNALSYVIEDVHLPVSFLHSLLASAFFALFVLMALGNATTGFTSFFRTDELEYLFILPLNPMKVFLLKFFENFFRSSAPMFLLGIATLLAYGMYFHLSVQDYLLIIFGVVLPFIIAAAALGILFLFVLIQISAYIPFRTMITVGLLATLALSALYFRSVHPVRQVQEIIQYFPHIEDYLSLSGIGLEKVRFIPSTWIASALLYLIEGDVISVLPNVVYIVLFTIILLGFVGGYASRQYFSLWLSAHDTLTSPKGTKQLRSLWNLRQVRLPLSKPIAALVKRDLWRFLREPVQWTHLLLFLLLLVIFITSMNGMTLFYPDPTRMTLLFLSNFTFCGFFLVAIAVRFVYPSVSREGQSFWMVRSSPLSVRRLYAYKVAIADGFLLLIGIPLVGITTLTLSPNHLLLITSLTFIACIAVVIANIALTTGAYFADMRENNPIYVASSRGATLTFLICMIYLTFGGVLLSSISQAIYTELINAIPYTPESLILLILSFIVISIVITLFSIFLGHRAIRKEEIVV